MSDATSRAEPAPGSRSPANYNYRHFSIPEDGDVPRGVRAGDEAADATLYDLDGDPVELSDLWRERPVVLEFGSITCPVFTDAVDRMDDLAAKYADSVDFYVVYTREAHPGQNYPGHRSFAEKLDCAAAARREESVDRTVLVDDLDGTMHRRYTPLPNAVYVIGTDGMVAHRADWTEPDRIDGVLSDVVAAGGFGAAVPPTDLETNFRNPRPGLVPEFYRVFRRAGPGSLRDFLATVPRMARHRIRERFGRER